MAAFWVYENSVRNHALIHRNTCPMCNDGQGVPDSPLANEGRWIPFDTYRQASSSAPMYRLDSGDCPTCRPADRNMDLD